jgi:hypothetical protein
MKTHTAEALRRMNFQSDIYGSSGWIRPNKLETGKLYTLHPTNYASVGGGREYIPLLAGTKITDEVKAKYNLH